MKITAGDYYATETDEESDLHKLKARCQIRTERDDSIIDLLLKEPQGTQQGFVSGSPSTAHATIGLAPNVTAQAGHALVAPSAASQATTGLPSASTATQPTFEPSTTIFRATPTTPAPLATPAPPANPCSTQAALAA
ncbi:hypothetical protein APHAL10511_000567 [Amanita phalloides]|nr:hypothetical protein APHAL10511_000567 [Amanita phalloides]